MLLRAFFVFILVLFTLRFSSAQVSTYKVYNLTSDDGLLSDFVDHVYQDSYGFLWVVNFEGLTRWDGHNFVRYQHSEKDSTTLSYNIAYCVFEDSQRRLWIGTIGGLNLYDREKDCFIKCNLNDDGTRVPVNAICEDSKHRLWLGTSNGLCSYDHLLRKADWSLNTKDSLSHTVIFGMDIDESDNLWLATFSGGVNKFSTATQKITHFLHIENNSNTICSNKTKSIRVDHNNNIWVGSFDRGITVLNKEGTVIQHYPSFCKGANQPIVLSIYEDHQRNIWVGVADDLLHYLDKSTNRFVPFENPPYKKYDVGCRSISSMCEDNFGNLWFGSHSNGLFYTNSNKNAFRYYHKSYTRTKGMPNDLALGFFEDKKHIIWMGTEGGGFCSLDPVATILNTYTTTSGPSSNTISDIQGSADGSMWLATMGGGLIQFDPATKKNKVYAHDPKNGYSIPYNTIKSILLDDTLLWIGTYGEGLAAYDLKNKHFIHKNNKYRLPFDMGAPAWINHLFKDSKKRLWIGTYGGLFLYNGKTIKRFSHSINPNSLINHDINMITEDSKGRIWVVTESGGLELYNESTGDFKHYSEPYDLPMILKSIVVDKQGKLWMGSNEGLIVFDPSKNKATRYDVSDGIQGNFFLQKSAFKSVGGTLYLGGSNGVTAFNPDDIKSNTAQSNFYFTDLYVFDALQKPGKENSPLQEVLLFTDKLELTHNQSFFTIGFSDINLYTPSKTLYAYKLDGLYDKWIQIHSERKVSFTNLDPGTYVLKVKYTTLNGQWKIADKKLTIVILPPWWKTWWFKLLFVLSLLGAATFYLYYRLSSIQKRNRQLEQEVSKRTQQLTEVNSFLLERNEEIKLQKERLEEYNEEMSRQSEKILVQQEYIVGQNQELEKTVRELEASNTTKDRFFSILAHDLRNPVAAIKGISDLFVSKSEQLKKQDLDDFIMIVQKSSTTLFNLVVSLLDWARTQTKNVSFSPSLLNMEEVVVKNIQLVEQQCKNKNIHVHVTSNPEHKVYADPNMLHTVVRNIISNSAKFTEEGGSISIHTEATPNSIILTISDTGVGMSEETLGGLFRVDKNNFSKGTSGEQGTGLGLIISKEFIEFNKGSLEVTSELSKGSSFKLTLPNSAQHQSFDTHLSEVSSVVYSSLVQEHRVEEKMSSDKIAKIKGRRVLIVEDSLEIRTQLRLLLSGTLEIFEAENGQEGLEKAITYQPSVIISDLLMPVMDGLEFCKHIKTDTATSHIPVILLTSQIDEASQYQSYEAGADVYMTKPIKQDILFQVIYNFIQRQENNNLKLVSSNEIYPVDLELNKLDETFLNDVIELIEKNIGNQNLDFQLLCDHTGLSRTVLYAKFKILTGQGVHDFIKSIRLKKSIQLLLKGTLTVSEIAYEVGFNSPSYYVRCFSKEYGQSPKEYATQLKNKR